MILRDYTQLSDVRKKHLHEKISFCSGTFDLTHAGHVLFFEDCKNYSNILVVAVGSDAIVSRYKGKNRPIMNEHVRLKMIDSLKPVNYCLINKYSDTPEDPLASLTPILSLLRPDLYVVNEDAINLPQRRRMVSSLGIELLVLPRTCPPEFDKISTTKLIDKIRQD